MSSIQTPDIMFGDQDDDTEEVINISAFPAKFVVDSTTIVLRPGERIRIHKMYTRKQQMAKDRDPVASAIENMTGSRVVPASDSRAPKQTMQRMEDVVRA